MDPMKHSDFPFPAMTVRRRFNSGDSIFRNCGMYEEDRFSVTRVS